MATLTYETNTAATTGTPTWTPVGGGNRIVFSGSATDLTANISTTAWQDGTHRGNGTPGTDQCSNGPNSGHNNNVKFLTTSTMSLNGAASQALNDTNLVQGACTFRIRLQNGTAVSTQTSRFFSYDGSTDGNAADGVECYAFERGVSATAWTLINDFSSAGKLNSGGVPIGGNNSGEFLDLSEFTSQTDASWYLAVSASGETAGGKTFGFKLTVELF